jgi:hypothetical protein
LHDAGTLLAAVALHAANLSACDVLFPAIGVDEEKKQNFDGYHSFALHFDWWIIIIMFEKKERE